MDMERVLCRMGVIMKVNGFKIKKKDKASMFLMMDITIAEVKSIINFWKS